MGKAIDLNNKKIIISRTDSIGDVMLTLPICAWLKKQFPSVYIIFLGKGYTKPIVEAYDQVDVYLDWNDYEGLPKAEQIEKLEAIGADAIIHVFPNKEIASLAKKAKIQYRVGTSHRAFHLLTCSHRVNFTRKNSNFHEAQLNHELLRPFGLNALPSLDEVIATTERFKIPNVVLPPEFTALKELTILHPKSQGSAREWPIEKYISLANELAEGGKTVVFTGTDKEGGLFRTLIPEHEKIIDSTGKLTLEQLMVFIASAKNLVACSTGPLHIAGSLGVNTVGLFSPRRPIHPGRWRALGPNVNILVKDEACPTCAQKKECNCIEQISVEAVKDVLK
ncbi:MAG: glycosyltransferase family 9 protein [Crocinitomicaceae bacterium]|nr:glycosyltransferase family 9 protein [Crocinitomicaceae bacterium]